MRAIVGAIVVDNDFENPPDIVRNVAVSAHAANQYRPTFGPWETLVGRLKILRKKYP